MTEQRPTYTFPEQSAPDQPAAQPAPMVNVTMPDPENLSQDDDFEPVAQPAPTIWLNKTRLMIMAKNTFANLRRAKSEVFLVTETVMTAKADYDNAKLAARANGLIVGKNEDERKDAQRAALVKEQGVIDQAESVLRAKEAQYARAAIDVDMVKTYLRIMELPDA